MVGWGSISPERLRARSVVLLGVVLLLSLVAITVVASHRAGAWQTVDVGVDASTGSQNGQIQKVQRLMIADAFCETHEADTEAGQETGFLFSTSSYFAFYHVPLVNVTPDMYVSKLVLHTKASSVVATPMLSFYLYPELHPELMDPQTLYGFIEHIGGDAGALLVGGSAYTSTDEVTWETSNPTVQGWVNSSTTDLWLLIYAAFEPDEYAHFNASGIRLEVVGDMQPPQVPSINGPIGDNHGETFIDLAWAAAPDLPLDGNVSKVQYQMGVWRGEASGEPDKLTDWTDYASISVYGLVDATEYYFMVRARDGWGHVSAWSEPQSTWIDVAPPPSPQLLALPAVTKGPAVTLTWSQELDVGPVRYRVEWSTDTAFATTRTYSAMADTIEYTVSDLLDGTRYYFRVKVVNIYGRESQWSAPLTTLIDASPPAVVVVSPEVNDTVGGAVAITGTVSDAALSSYRVQYRPASGQAWSDIVPETSTAGLSGVLAVWATDGLENGGYVLRLTARDSTGANTTVEVALKLVNSHLQVDPSDIIVLPPVPTVGEKATLYAVVHNTGGSPARGVQVNITDGDTVIVQRTIDIPAHGYIVIPVDFKGRSSHAFKVTASNPAIGEATFPDPVVVNGQEKGKATSSPATLLAAVALIVALLALVLALMRPRSPTIATAPPDRQPVVKPEPIKVVAAQPPQ